MTDPQPPDPEDPMLEYLRDVFDGKAWSEPPDEFVERLDDLEADLRAPPLPDAVEEIDLTPAGVRGASAPIDEEMQILAPASKDAQLSLMIRPPAGDGRWSMEGRLWLLEPSTSSVDVVLSEGEHVLTRQRIADGERFHLEEVAGPGWQLEFHLPTGSVLVVSNPLL